MPGSFEFMAPSLGRTPAQPGVTGTSTNAASVLAPSAGASGIVGSTQSSSEDGVFGKNTATAPTPAGVVAGHGVFGLTTVPNAHGVFGANNNPSPQGAGVAGNNDHGTGVLGTTQSSSAAAIFGSNSATAATPAGSVGGHGMFGLTTVPNAHGVFGANNNPNPQGAGVAGENAHGTGVLGTTQSSSAAAIFGSNSATAPTPQGTVAGHGVFGLTMVPNAHGVFGANNNPSPQGAGVAGESAHGNGIIGTSQSNSDSGVFGRNDGGGNGVAGQSASGIGVLGFSNTGGGVVGTTSSERGDGIFGNNTATAATPQGTVAGYGVFGLTTVPNGAGVFGANNSSGGPDATGVAAVSQQGTGLFATGGQKAARFIGDVDCSGTHTCHDVQLTGADCAEEFDTPDGPPASPGTVLVCDAEGLLMPSGKPYDRTVAGVVSGGGDYQPGVVLDRQPSRGNRVPVALLGKVYCNVDADDHPIAVGDLLTTSARPGHAMKAGDSARAFGAVVGKALRPLASGQGQIPVLVALQ